MPETPKSDTPGKPTDESSRQQKHDRQGTQTGSRELDERSSGPESQGKKAPPVPPGPK